MKSESMLSQPAVTIIGHSLGGATGMLVAAELEKRGMKVHYLFTLDPACTTPCDYDGGARWINVYRPKTVLDIPAEVPYAGYVLAAPGALLSWLLGGGGPSQDTFSNAVGVVGGKLGSEPGALNLPTDLSHGNADGMLRAALSHAGMESVSANRDLIGSGIIRFP